jgi:hypothetical protein
MLWTWDSEHVTVIFEWCSLVLVLRMFLVSYHDKYPAVRRDIRYLDLYWLFDVYCADTCLHCDS